jgi:hypothetical protein
MKFEALHYNLALNQAFGTPLTEDTLGCFVKEHDSFYILLSYIQGFKSLRFISNRKLGQKAICYLMNVTSKYFPYLLLQYWKGPET